MGMDRLERIVKLDDQEVGVLRLDPESEFADGPVRKSEFCIRTDEADASSFYTVVHAGQLFYLRNISDKEDIEVTFEAGIFVDPDTGSVKEGAISVPKRKDGKEFPVKVRIKPNGTHNETAWLRTEGAGNGHGSPTLIIRKPPVGES